jgi:hypothetical protein
MSPQSRDDDSHEQGQLLDPYGAPPSRSPGSPFPPTAVNAEAEEYLQRKKRALLAALALHGRRCRKCGGVLMRSRSRGLDGLLKLLTRRRPHRCRGCGWRGWEHPVAIHTDSIAAAQQLLDDVQNQTAQAANDAQS